MLDLDKSKIMVFLKFWKFGKLWFFKDMIKIKVRKKFIKENYIF